MVARGVKKPAKGLDRAKVERAVRLLLEGIHGTDLRQELKATPRRVCDLYEEILGGLWEDPSAHLKPIRTSYDNDLIVVKDIRFVSVCEHHMLPFIGKASVAYAPRGGRIVGISKIVRLVDTLARRLQIQERLTREIADAIDDKLKPSGVFVFVEAEHLCMTIRGVRKPGSLIVTTEARGTLKHPERQAIVLSSLSR
jgi:GTP cyclohydrolase I